MLHEFLTARRAELIERCRVKVAKRSVPHAIETERAYGIPHFLDQLIETLQAKPERSRKISGATDGSSKSALSEMGISAARHGHELCRQGCTVEQVIRDYGDLCQAITDAAFENSARIEVDEFRTLNRCLDNAIADSVTEWAYHSNLANEDNKAERVDFFIYQLRKLIHTATFAVIDRIHIDVEDNCGGLGAGEAEKMFLPSTPCGAADEAARGLTICRRNVKANNGVLSVRDVPGSGCVFTINLPRHTLPSSSV